MDIKKYSTDLALHFYNIVGHTMDSLKKMKNNGVYPGVTFCHMATKYKNAFTLTSTSTGNSPDFTSFPPDTGLGEMHTPHALTTLGGEYSAVNKQRPVHFITDKCKTAFRSQDTELTLLYQ